MPIQRLAIRLFSWLASSAMLAVQPFPNAHDQPLACWKGPVFQLSQNYPAQPPTPGPLPWSSIDFKTAPVPYMKAVLEYALDGNVEVDWEVQKNLRRKWYHAPWMHWGEGGREFIHGLTRERHSRPKELWFCQKTEAQTWAVSVYNELGGYTLGRVWADPSAPNPVEAHFRAGTVAVKLLFTSASPDEVPYLEGSKVWQAFVASHAEPRKLTDLRLLQVDFAVRDERAKKTGWVFGTFQYDRDAPGATRWQKLVPVALGWGNDYRFTPDDLELGLQPKESWTNSEARIVRYRKFAGMDLGWAGRANGPVDNPRSSCLSCHATAQVPATIPLAPDEKLPVEEKLLWFQNLKGGESLDPERAHGLDYSLQLSVGIQNFYDWVELVRNHGVATARPKLASKPVFLQPGRGPFVIYRVSGDEAEQKVFRLLPVYSMYHAERQ